MIKKLGSMCKDLNFDEKMLDTMLHKGFDLDQEFVSSDRPSYPYRTVLLQEAVENNNVRMVERRWTEWKKEKSEQGHPVF